MKRTKQCPKCQSLKIGYLPLQPDAEDVLTNPNVKGVDPNMPALGGLGRELTHRALGVSTKGVETGWFMQGMIIPLLGRLEAFVCTACGYHETYVASPATIPWNELVGFVWINEPGAPDGPFR